MSTLGRVAAPAALAIAAVSLFTAATPDRERLERHRNLGKALYENPGTPYESVEEFRKALALAPDSARERLNYGLALLRAGKTAEGTAELERVQKQDPSIPHSWFNLGLVYKRAGDHERAIRQFRRMIELVPGEAVSHYNLGVLYKLVRQPELSIEYFQKAAALDRNIAAPHFQLYTAYRQQRRAQDAARELALFQQLKKEHEGNVIPEDMEWSFYAEVYDPVDRRTFDAPPAAEVKFEARKLASPVDPKTAGLLALDASGTGKTDLLAWSSRGMSLYRNGRDRTDAGFADLKGVISVAAGDFNNDGLTDLCVLTAAGPVLYANEKGRFVKRSATLQAGRFEKALWLDYDHDYDLDLFLFGRKSVLMRNQGAAGFADRTADFPFMPGHAIAATAFRLIADTKGTDLTVSYRDRTAVLYRDRLAGRFEAQPLDAIPAGATGLLPGDIDNDGWIDLLSSSGYLLNRNGTFEARSPAGSIFADLENRGIADLIGPKGILRNLGRGDFAPPVRPSGFLAGAAWAAADFDLDGRMDLASVAPDGSIRVLENRTSPKNQWARIQINGIRNLKLAAGAEVEVKQGSLYQKRIYDGLPLLFGLGEGKEVDAVRITWPNGLIQSETRQPTGRPVALAEAQRLSGSCPMIFAWNGREFEFITDVLGVAPLGASAGDGEYFPVDHDEYVQIPGESLVPHAGAYEIRVTEELREVSYLDRIQLIAVDHPANVEVFTNDKFKSPPFPEFRLFGVTRRVYPRAARDTADRDVLPALVSRDRRYAGGFHRTYTGIAETHTLDLDFGNAAPGNRAVLVLNGWVDWADGSTFLAAAQESKDGLVLPYLQVKDAAGDWRTVIEDMGIPAGKPKTIVVDLTGKFLSRSREVRIVTNLCVYWDEVFLSESSGAPPVRMTALDPASADLRFRGFSKAIVHPERAQPEAFDYRQVSPVSMWNPTPGLYTRYGDAGELLRAADDRFVVMGSGDEVRLLFRADALPAIRSGWKRDFLLFVDGWAKDGDLNTAFSETVDPLPFHKMTRYPYSNRESHPQMAESRRYNTRPALKLLRPLHD